MCSDLWLRVLLGVVFVLTRHTCRIVRRRLWRRLKNGSPGTWLVFCVLKTVLSLDNGCQMRRSLRFADVGVGVVAKEASDSIKVNKFVPRSVLGFEHHLPLEVAFCIQ